MTVGLPGFAVRMAIKRQGEADLVLHAQVHVRRALGDGPPSGASKIPLNGLCWRMG
jgi:hypothetical protein